nr:DUF4406 domain-containing protein [uncultured Serratia sp.]
MKTYIAGPMTGLPGFNRPAFFAAAKDIAAAGHVALNPAVLPDGLSEVDYMCVCIAMLQRADAIYLLDGWRSSEGARAEFALAEKLGIEILFQDMTPLQCLYTQRRHSRQGKGYEDAKQST